MAEGEALMLGVSGLRGVFGASLTPMVVVRYAGALAAYLQSRAGRTHPKKRVRIVVGHDGRVGAHSVYALASATLEMAGVDVLLVGKAMTPTMGVMVDRLGADAGLQISASHNPQNWCGLKPIVRSAGARGSSVDASAPDRETAAAIIRLYHGEPAGGATWDRLGVVSMDHPAPGPHPKIVVEALDELGALRAIRKAKFAAATDTVCASASLATPEFLAMIGCEDRPVYDASHAAGVFPHTPEPTESNLGALRRFTKKHRAAVGFAQDPDADRLALVDEKGRYIGEEYTLVLAARALAAYGALRKGSTIAVNLSTSRMIDDLAREMGCTVLRTPVGEANVVSAMKSRGSVVGGEGNGGVIWPRVTYIRDSFSAMGLVLGLMAKERRPLSAIVDASPSYAIVKRKVDLRRQEDARPAVEKLAKHYAAERVDRQDGVRIDFDRQSAWVHVRASNTEPIMRLIAEAPTHAQAAGLLDEVAALV